VAFLDAATPHRNREHSKQERGGGEKEASDEGEPLWFRRTAAMDDTR
jgi:hypothetical protein